MNIQKEIENTLSGVSGRYISVESALTTIKELIQERDKYVISEEKSLKKANQAGGLAYATVLRNIVAMQKRAEESI